MFKLAQPTTPIAKKYQTASLFSMHAASLQFGNPDASVNGALQKQT